MRSLYVVGGQQRSPRSVLNDDQNWYEYQKGIILQVDLETQAVETRVKYVSPPEVCANGDAVLFKAGTLCNNNLYVCTQTEVLTYTVPNFTQVGYVSLPSFNDVHHVRPTPEGNLLIANSGLEMVLEVTPDGQVLREWNVLGEDPWARFSKKIDYRKGVSTKPHKAHPNYVFYVGEDVWATRFEQRDAICLTRPERRIHIGTERVHDGVVYGDFIYFTTVNGNVVIVNSSTLKTEEVVDLNTMSEEGTLLGWCRSVFLDKERAWIGFSRIRPTKFRDTLSWVRLGFNRSLPTHIACYDLQRKRHLTDIDLEAHGLNAVFSIFPGGLDSKNYFT